MAAFHSPLADPTAWTLSLPGLVTVPDGLRYAGERLIGLRATRATAGGVRMPALGVLRSVTPAAGPDTGRRFVEVQVNPFPIRRVAVALLFGLPTFYVVFDAGAASVPFEDFDTEAADQPLGSVTTITVAMGGQDRVARDPALWSREILAALTAGGGTTTSWQPFADHVAATTASGPTAPVWLLDHAGRPRTTGSVDVTIGAQTAQATLDPADFGNLQRTVARLRAVSGSTFPFANLFGAGQPVGIRPRPQPGTDFQLARVEDRQAAAAALGVTPQQRHLSYTDLHRWFAAQRATGAPGPPLARFTRDNRLTPLVNGPEFFDDLFRRLAEAIDPSGGFHLTGWSMFPDVEFTTSRDGDPPNLPVTLQQAAQRIGDAGGGTRFLPSKFIQLDPNSSAPLVEILVFDLIVMGILIADAGGVDFVRTDAGGAVILIALLFLNAILISIVVETGGAPFEPNKSAVEVLDPLPNAACTLAPFPATVADNPVAPALSDFPFDTLFDVIRYFGIFHQKFAVVKTPAARIGYCGGIDVNPDRLDDVRHLNNAPYHDVHAKVEGPAVSDLELSFAERWSREGSGDPLAFEPAAATGLAPPGTDAVQVARTYFRAAETSRELGYAPQGDRTIADTMLAGIAAAREFIYVEDQYLTPPAAYRDALVAKVAAREIRSLVVVIPGIADQPFGEIVRTQFISDLRDADAGAGIVRIGYPRRHYTLKENEIRASSGRCLLKLPLVAGTGIEAAVWLGPPERLPDPPFWVSIDGELMYAFDESTMPNPDAENMLPFQVVRGDATRLVNGGPAPKGARPRAHEPGAPATVVDLAGIYVHAKMMIVDDVFAGIGSANLNRRGLFHDGEINVFTVPQALKATRGNPVAALRRRLWAEMLDLPLATAGPLLEDPLAAARLFDRSPLAGNRFTDVDAFPEHIMFGAKSGDGLVMTVLQILGFSTAIAPDHVKLFDGVVDPTSAIEAA